mgnify:FL=1|nr:MAG TPA: minor tail protein [Caudoviricetes sp.]
MELFKLLGTIAIDNSEANKALNETAKNAGSSSKEVESAVNKVGTVALGLGKAVVTAGAVIGGAWIAAIEGSREYRTEMGKLDTAFVTNGHSSEAAKRTYSDLNSVLGDSGQAVEAANHLALLTDNEKDLGTWTDICTGVYATFGASLPIEGLTEAANETAKVGEVTGPLADALNWAGISEDEFNDKLAKCSGEQERQKLIMDTLNGTYSKAADQYKKTNKDVIAAEKAQEKLTDAFAEFGRIGEPILTLIKSKVADMVAAAIPHLENFINKIKDAARWIKDNEEKVKLWSGVIAIAIATVGGFVLVLAWAGIMQKAAAALKIVTLAVKALNIAMRANIIGLVVTAILGLVAAFIYLWKNCDSFRNFWIGLWKIIQSAAKAAWKAISKAWEGVGKWFKSKFEQVQKAGKSAMDSVKKWFSDALKAIKKAWSAVVGFFKGIWKGIQSAFSATGSWFSKIFRSAWNGVKSVWNGARSFFSGIWSGIRGIFGSVGSWFRGKFQAAWSSIRSVFSGWGSFFGGLWTKIKSKFSSIGSALGKAMGDSVKSGLNKVLSTIEKTINKGIGLINKAINLANKLPGINVGNVPTLSLPRLAKGGVLKKGQVGVLEGSGAEAVVPLENNHGWLSKVAADLNKMRGSAVDVQQILAMLNRIIDLLGGVANMRVCLESGVLVGELTPAIDRQLSDRWSHSMRGNTR